ncbi:hypothetical protein RYX36_028291 [Vicia faba]
MEVLTMTGLIIHGCILDLYIYFTNKASLFWFCYRQDVAIAYGFNVIKDQAIVDNKGSKRLVASLKLLPLNELSDLIRKEVMVEASFDAKFFVKKLFKNKLCSMLDGI